jgi:hypothetical protein
MVAADRRMPSKVVRSQPSKAIEQARSKYADSVVLRAAIQAIPHIGGPLDTLLAGRAAQIQLQRVESFARELARQLAEVEKAIAKVDDDAVLDLMLTTLDKVARTRSDQKRQRFARIVTNQITKGAAWDEAEGAVRLLAELDDIHVEVIDVAIRAPVVTNLFDRLRVVSLTSKPIREEGSNDATAPLVLHDALPQYSLARLRMACAELVARGLLHDEGVGRLGVRSMEYFVSTDLATWFAAWITKEIERGPRHT